MRDPKRIRPLLDELAMLWERNPDLRLGQIVSGATKHYAEPGKTTDPYAYEDEDLMWMIRRMLSKDRP